MRKGYLKIHVVAVDIKKKKIVSLDVTSEEVHENGTMLKRLVDNASESNDVKRVIADGAYDGKENFRYRSVHNRIESCSQGKEKLQSINRLLPLKKNNNSAAGAKEVERWTAKVKYGFRLVAETDCIFFYQKDIWRICFSKEVSKYGK